MKMRSDFSDNVNSIRINVDKFKVVAFTSANVNNVRLIDLENQENFS